MKTHWLLNLKQNGALNERRTDLTTWELELTPEEWPEPCTMLDDGPLEEKSEMS
jgi:hypothetical protein